MAEEIKKPEQIECARARDGDEFLGVWTDGIRQPQDPILQGRGAGSDLRLYDQVRGDAQVWSTLQQRRDAVVALPWSVEPGDDRPASLEAADELKEQLAALAMDSISRKMLWGVFYGYGVAEILWGIEGNRASFKDIRVRRARRFGFDVDGGLMLRQTVERAAQQMPDRKFWVMTTGADTDDEPYGLGLAHLLYWPTYFRRHGLKAWMVALNKYATPTAVGKFPKGASPEDVKKLLAALAAIQSDSAITLPEGMEVELLSAAKSPGLDFKSFHEFLDGMIAKIVLSQTMTTDDGGSLSQSKVHLEVRDEVADADAELLCGSFNTGPGTWWTEWNYGDAAAPPLLKRKKDDPENADAAATRDTHLRTLGWEPTEERIRKVYGDGYQRRTPAGDGQEPPTDLKAGDGPDAIASFAAQLAGDGVALTAVNDVIAPIMDALDGADSLEGVASAIDGLSLSDTALEPLREHLAQAAFAASIGGEVGAPLRDGVETETS